MCAVVNEYLDEWFDGCRYRSGFVAFLLRPARPRYIKEDKMQWITVAIPPFGSIEQFDKVHTELGEAPAGLQARYVGTANDGKLRLIALWESKEHADRFFAERLGPVLAKALGPEPVGRPEVTGIDVERSYVREPVA